MELNVTKKRLDTSPIRYRLTQGEAMVDRPRIIMHRNYEGLDIYPLSYEIRAVSEKETMVRRPLEKTLEGGLLVLTWTVTKEFTAIAGKLELTIVGMDTAGNEIIKITSDGVRVRPDPEGDWVAPPPDVVEDAINQMAVIQAAAVKAKNDAEAIRKQTETIKTQTEAIKTATAGIRDETSSIKTATAAIRDETTRIKNQTATLAEEKLAEMDSRADANIAEVEAIKTETEGVRDDTADIKTETEKVLSDTENVAQTVADLADKAKQYAELASQIAYGQKGWFETPEALKAAYPTGQNGWWAVVGSTDTIWTWDSDSGAWVDTRQGTDMSKYPQWSQLSNKLLVPCACTYDTAAHLFRLTRKDVRQEVAGGAELTFIPPAAYSRGDKVEFEGTAVSVEYAESPVDVQSGAWLANRPAKLIWYADNEQGGI